MQFVNNKNVVLLSLLGGALTLLTSYYLSNETLLLFSALLFFSSMAIWKFGYMIAPLIGQTLNLGIKESDFELVPSQDVLIKKTQDGFFTTSFLSIRLRDSTEFKTDSQKSSLMEMFERALTSLRFTLKISFVICNLELSDYIQKIEEKRSLAEHRKSQSKDSSTASQLKREISYYSSQINRLTDGEKPMQILAYAQTTAFGVTKEEAVSRLRSQAKEAAAVLSNTLASDVDLLRGEDLLNCLRWGALSPVSKAQIQSSLF